jgi:hypothetical protein
MSSEPILVTLMDTVAGTTYKAVANATISAVGWKGNALVETPQKTL